MKIRSFWACFFGFASLLFYLIFLLIFRFVEFSCQHMLGLFSVKLPIFGLIFEFTCLFLQNNLASPYTVDEMYVYVRLAASYNKNIVSNFPYAYLLRMMRATDFSQQCLTLKLK